MKKIRFSSNHKPRVSLEITPMIDMVFLLVAFFMVSSSIEKNSTIHINLPSAEQSGDYIDSETTVSIDKDNKIYIDDELYSDETFEKYIKQNYKSLKDRPIRIKGDKSCSYDSIIKVMDVLGRNNLNNFMLSTVKK